MPNTALEAARPFCGETRRTVSGTLQRLLDFSLTSRRGDRAQSHDSRRFGAPVSPCVLPAGTELSRRAGRKPYPNES